MRIRHVDAEAQPSENAVLDAVAKENVLHDGICFRKLGSENIVL